MGVCPGPGSANSRRWFAAILTAIFLLPAASLHAQQTSVEIDASKSTVEFTLHDVLHTVHGTFQLRQGNITVSENGKAAGAIVVDATSGASGNHGRDSKMHKEIIESAKYPDITFTPTEITGAAPTQGDSDVDLRGALKMHGQDHEIVIHATVHIDGSELTAEANFPVKYVDWGVKNPSTLFLRVSDTVQIRVLVRGRFVSRP